MRFVELSLRERSAGWMSAPPAEPADIHGRSRKVTLFLQRVRQLFVKCFAVTLSYLLQCEPDTAWHFSKFVLQNTQPSHEMFASCKPCQFHRQPAVCYRIIKIWISFQGKVFLPGCYFLAFLSYMFWVKKNIWTSFVGMLWHLTFFPSFFISCSVTNPRFMSFLSQPSAISSRWESKFKC